MSYKKIYVFTLYIVIVYIIINASCFSEKKFEMEINKKFPQYSLMSYKKGNFRNSKAEEYIVFLKENILNQYLPQDRAEILKRNDIGKVVVVVINNDIMNVYDLNAFSLGYTDKWITNITRGNPQFGTWDGYCYVTDFNDNGLDEVVFFELSGRAFLPYIFEFKDSSMQVVLNPPPFKSVGMTEITTLNENGKKMIKIYGYGGEGIPGGKRDWYKYAWDDKSKFYSIVEKGVE